MSVQSEILRLSEATETIRSKFVELGIANTEDKLDVLAEKSEALENKGAVSLTVTEGKSVPIPAGYHNGSGTVTGLSDTTGDATKYKTQTKGPITPTKSQQSITPDAGYYALSSVTVGAIPSEYQNVTSVTATADTVLTGKAFVNKAGETIAGTMPNNGTKTVKLTTSKTEYDFEKTGGYYAANSKVYIDLENKSATPATSSFTVTPSEGKLLASVTVNAIDKKYGDTTNTNITSAHVLKDMIALGNDNGTAVAITGSMPNHGTVNATITGLTDATKTFTLEAGYVNGLTVSLTNDIETELAKI